MCNAKSVRKNRDEVANWFRVQLNLQLEGEIPDGYRPRFRIGPRQRGLIARPTEAGVVVPEMGSWGLIPPGKTAKDMRALMTNARDDSITSKWPWRMVYRHGRCIVPADGFYEPEKVARSKARVPWRYYSRPDDGLFAMAGLYTETADPETGEVTPTYTVITTSASADLVIHDRMPVILDPADVATWLRDDGIPQHLRFPAPDGMLQSWRVHDKAKNSRVPDDASTVQRT